MKINQFELWLANLNPKRRTEPGKKRPVVVVQSNLLNNTILNSTIVCPITTNVIESTNILRLHLKKAESKLDFDSDIMVDQLRSIDNKRFIQKLGVLPESMVRQIKNSLKNILDLDA